MTWMRSLDGIEGGRRYRKAAGAMEGWGKVRWKGRLDDMKRGKTT